MKRLMLTVAMLSVGAMSKSDCPLRKVGNCSAAKQSMQVTAGAGAAYGLLVAGDRCLRHFDKNISSDSLTRRDRVVDGVSKLVAATAGAGAAVTEGRVQQGCLAVTTLAVASNLGHKFYKRKKAS